MARWDLLVAATNGYYNIRLFTIPKNKLPALRPARFSNKRSKKNSKVSPK